MKETFYHILHQLEGKREFEGCGVQHYKNLDQFINEMKDNGFDDIIERLENGTVGGFDSKSLECEFILWDWYNEEFFFLTSTDEDEVNEFIDYILTP